MQVAAKGELRLNHFRTEFPYQKQPGVSIPDLMSLVAPGITHQTVNLEVGQLSACAHASAVLVPHNQTVSTITGATEVDHNVFRDTAVPDVAWKIVVSGGAAKVVNVRDIHTRNQRLQCIWDRASDGGHTDPHLLNLKADASFECQGLEFTCSRVVWGGILPGYSATYDLRCNVAFQRLSLKVLQSGFAILAYNNKPPLVDGTEDETGWVTLTDKLRIGGDSRGAKGQSFPGTKGAQTAINLQLMNGVFQISVGGEQSPYKVVGITGGPTEKPLVASVGVSGGVTVAYCWVDENGNESALSPGTIDAWTSGSITVQVPCAPFLVKKVRIYTKRQGDPGFYQAVEYTNVYDVSGYVTTTVTPPTSGTTPADLTRPTITGATVKASYFSLFEWGLRPYKWAVDPSLLSNPIPRGFTPDPSTPDYYVVYGLNTACQIDSGGAWDSSATPALKFPTGSSIVVTNVGDPTTQDAQYGLDMTNATAGTYAGEPYADFTAVVTRVDVCIDGVSVRAGSDPRYPVTPSRAVVPKDVVQRMVFDAGVGSISNALAFTVNNMYGEWATLGGNLAAKLWLGYRHAYPGIARSNGDPVNGLWKRFTGIAHGYSYDVPSANRSTVLFQCDDRLLQIGEVPLTASTIVDGWNHYAAMAYYALAAGITADRLAFANLVMTRKGLTLKQDPNGSIAPFQSAPGDPRPYFLPFGTGMQPWTPRNRAMPVRGLMDLVRKASGNLIYFDQDDRLQYHEFVPYAPGQSVKVFSNNPATWGVDGEPLREYFSLKVDKDTDGVRNIAAFIGLDPFREYFLPIVTRREDSLSIDAPTGQEPLNFKGYPVPFVWSDPRFASLDYASTSADRALRMLRVPNWSVYLETWLQPDLFPTDIITITDELKTGVANVPLTVFSITNRWSFSGDGRPSIRSLIEAKYLV